MSTQGGGLIHIGFRTFYQYHLGRSCRWRSKSHRKSEDLSLNFRIVMNYELSYCAVYMHVTCHVTWNVAADLYDNSCGITYKVAMHFYTTQQWVAELRIWEMRWTLMLVVEQAIGKSLLERWYRRVGLERQYHFRSSFLRISWWCLEAIWRGWVWQSCITASFFKFWFCACVRALESQSPLTLVHHS